MGNFGNLNKNGDYVSGDPSNVDETKFHTGSTSKSFGYLAKEISCEHGRLTIGCFDKTLDCGESWSDICGCINFN